MRIEVRHLAVFILVVSATSVAGCTTFVDRMGGDPSGGTDGDGDGWTVEQGDCDDADPAVHPGADETCNGIDDDCAGGVPADEADADGDGSRICAGDCDDADPAVHPGADETCNGIDDDCDGLIDDDAIDAPTWYADGDGDCFGDPEETTSACDAPGGFVGDSSDCDDTSAAVFPGAQEDFYSGIDEDCDGWVDEVDVCLDGMGDVTTIQDGVDLAGNGAPVLVCPGTYVESVVLDERSVSIIGTGASKTDVLIDAGGQEYALDGRSGLSTTSYELRNLSLTGSTLAAVEGYGSTTLVDIDISNITSGYVIYADLAYAHGLDIHDNNTEGNLFYAWAENGDSIVTRSWFHDNVARTIMRSSGTIGNCLFSGNTSESILAASAVLGEDTTVSSIYVSNNTFADNDSQYGILSINGVYSAYDYNEGYGPFSAIIFQGNIFTSNQSEYQVLLSWGWCNYSFQQVLTHLNHGYNLFWEYSGLAWNEENTNNDCEYYAWHMGCDCYTFETDDFAEMLTSDPSNLFIDPEIDPLGTPPYSLMAGSPAIDAGDPDPAYNDTDGTRNDLGAYGGPGGDWGGGM